MGLKAYLADLTSRMYIGSTKNFEVFRVGLNPIILEIRGFKPLLFTLSK